VFWENIFVATFTFSAEERHVTFECRHDDAAFSSCTSPQHYTGLADGEHNFAVRATDSSVKTGRLHEVT
jgi:hypothetical protein